MLSLPCVSVACFSLEESAVRNFVVNWLLKNDGAFKFEEDVRAWRSPLSGGNRNRSDWSVPAACDCLKYCQHKRSSRLDPFHQQHRSLTLRG